MLIARRLSPLAFLAFIAATASAQDGYRTPPDAIAKILDSPAPQVAAVSADRKWLLVTTSDVIETPLEELAEPTLYLASQFKEQEASLNCGACLRGPGSAVETTRGIRESGMLEWLFYGIFLYSCIRAFLLLL